MRTIVARAAVAVAVTPVLFAVAPAGAHACSLALLSAEVVAPAEQASFVQTNDAVPVSVRFGRGLGLDGLGPVQFGIARLNTSAAPPAGTSLPADVGTVVETGQLAYDPATGTWNASANGNGWAQTPGEYVWQAAAAQTFPATPPRVPDANGHITGTSCDRDTPLTVTHDGRWVHRITVLGASAVTAKAAKARDGRAKVSGTIAAAFPGKVRLAVACPGKRTRTTFVAPRNGRWSRKVHAKRGCRVEVSVAARQGWAESADSARVG